MASYEAVIKLIVQGEEALKRIQERVDKLYKTIDDLESKKKYAGSEAAAKYVREQANALERVLAVSKQLIQQDERRIVQQSKLNAAVDLYERRLQQTVNSGAAGLKQFQSQIADIQAAFAYFKDKGNVQAVQALATELGRMVEYSNNVNRNERARVANQSKVFAYVKQINAYEEKGLDVARAREKLAQFTEVAGSNQLNTAKQYAEAVERQLKLLKEQEQLQRRVAAETASLQEGLEKLLKKQAALENSKLDQKALQIQQALDRQAAAAAETAAQTEKLNARQTQFIERTNAAAQAAARQTAEFYRLQRLAKEFNAIRATAPAPQLMLPSADMLNAAVRGIQALETAEDRRNRELAEGAARLKELERLETARERRAQKLQGIADYQRPAAPAAPAAKGMRGMLQKPGVADALIGGSFPLLFGGGPGATIGGALGGLAGGAMGGPLGMALSLALSAVGQQLDAAIAKVVEMQKALDGLNIDKLRDSFVYVNAELETTVTKLIEAGKIEEARAVAAEEVARQTGAIGSSIKDSANATNLLGAAWNEYLGAISTSLSLLGAPFSAALALILKGFTLITQAVNTIISAIGQGLKGAFESFIRLFPGGDQLLKNMAKTFNIITEEEQKLIAQLKLANAVTERQIVLNRELLGLQTRLTLGRTQAEKEINAAVNAQIAQKQINADFDVKAIELRKQYGGIAALFGQKELELALLNNEAKRAQALEEQKIKDLLVQQALELEANAQKYEAVRQAINLQVEALDRANSVRQSALSLQSALNDLYGAQLEREYRLATTSEQRLQIALKQFQQQVNAARIEYEQAILNNKLLVDKAYLQTQLIKLRYEELAAEKEIAIAQAIARKNTDEEIAKIAAGYDRALGVQEQIVAAAEEQLGSTIEIAANQDGIAEAVYKTKVLSAEAALAQKLSTDEIGMSKKEADELATYMSNVAQGAVETERQTRILNKTLSAGKRATDLMAAAMEGVASAASRAAIEIGKAVAKQRELNAARGGSPVTLAPAAEGAFWPGGFKAFAQGGVVNRPTMGLIGEGGESEYIVPESKAAGFATNYLFGQRGAAAIPDAGNTDGSAGTPVINITTGPVVEFDGQRYVTLADMERAMRITADSVIGKLRTPGSRIALGIS